MRRVRKFYLVLFTALTAALQVSAAPPDSGPNISFSPSSLTFAKQPLGTSKTESILISNTGTTILHVTAASIDNPAFTLGGCPVDSSGVLPPLANCELGVKFTPTAPGVFNATLSVTDDAPGSPQAISVTATATAIDLQPRMLNFRLVEPGQLTASKTVTVINKGNSPFTISSIAINGSAAKQFLIQSNTCPQVLSAGVGCALQVAFAPTVEGNVKAVLTVVDDDPASPQNVLLSGDGTDVLITPVVLKFDKFRTPYPITVTNVGVEDVTIASITINNFEGETPFYISDNACPSILRAGGNCVVQVEFYPEFAGLKEAQLVVTDTDGGSPQIAFLYGKE